MSIKAGKRLVPALRFPEFRDSSGWAKNRLNRVATPVKERGEQNASSQVLTLSGEVGIVSQGDYFGKKIAGEDTNRYIAIKRNDFVYNDRTTKRFIYGAIKRLSRYEAGLVSPIYKCFRFQDSQDPVFWESYFESGSHERQLKKLINEGARAGRYNISIDSFLSISVWSPLLAEQARIAACLSSLDTLITAQAQKIEALMAHKKGLMQQLFPVKGETVPRLPFPEFRRAGAWKESKAEKLFANRVEKGESELPIYSVTINEGMIKRASLDRDFNDIAEPEGNKKAHRLDIAYNMMRMWQGACGVAVEDCMVSPAYIVLAPKKGVNAVFFGYLFKLPQYLEKLTSHSRGLTLDRLRLYYKDFAEIALLYPSIQEQKRIADCLVSVDELIRVNIRKLEALNTQKQGLMQGLFLSINEAEG